ncbi:small ubiquitin-related modifier 2-like [Bidens hawaiensis]|uniref:small ubiquitin-related modifier 2-like n=1 Tax=Bidens hawaiensis TaxID=980011 RepID=UPI004049B3D5
MANNKISEEESAAAAAADSVVVLVKDQRNTKLYFKMKRDQPVKKVLIAFCKRTNVSYREVTCLLNGSRFQPHLTSDQLNLENGDEFDVMSHVLGGGD